MAETEDGVIQIPVQEFDGILDDLKGPKFGNMYYDTGRGDALEAFHHRIYESADIIIE